MSHDESTRPEDTLTLEERLKVIQAETMFLDAFNAAAEEILREDEKDEIQELQEKIKHKK